MCKILFIIIPQDRFWQRGDGETTHPHLGHCEGAGYGISVNGLERISERIVGRGGKIGRRQDIGKNEIDAILHLCLN